MLSTINEMRTISATSMIDGQNIMLLTAGMSTQNGTNITQTIQDATLYQQHKEEADSDFEEFRRYVLDRDTKDGQLS